MELFDVSEMTETDIGHLEYVVNSPSWKRVFRPFYERVENMYTQLLLDPDPSARKKYGGTKYLRAGANNIRKTLDFFDRMIAETQTERVIKARQELGKQDTAPDYAEDEEF